MASRNFFFRRKRRKRKLRPEPCIFKGQRSLNLEVYNRKEKTIYTDVQYGGGFLKRLYGTKAGRFVMPLVLSRGVSRIGGLYTDTFLSRAHIRSFIRKNKIDMQDYEDRKFRSLNDFFTRKVKEGKRPLDPAGNALVSPADSKLRIYPITEDSCFEIKGNTYTVRSLVGEKTEISGYQGGMCLVFRLSVDDYHRYCYPDSGKTAFRLSIKGKLHTVCDISDKYKVFQENSRFVSVLDTEHFGEIIMIEVGALMVGRIVDHGAEVFSRGQEKGFFKLGGSTIVLPIGKDKLVLDEDIRDYLKKGMEVKLRCGERVGVMPQ